MLYQITALIALFAGLTALTPKTLTAQSTSEAKTIVYVTKTGEKYHKGTCHNLRQSKIETNLKEAKENGYTACPVCKPDDNTGTRKPDTETKPHATSVQCSATTQSGSRCKRMTKSANGKCWQHGGKSL